MLIRDLDLGRVFFARLESGEDIILQIAHLAGEKAVKTGYFSAIGSLSQAELGYYDQATREYLRIPVEEPVELACCSGSISLFVTITSITLICGATIKSSINLSLSRL